MDHGTAVHACASRCGKRRIQRAVFRDETTAMTTRHTSEDDAPPQVDLLGAEVDLAVRAKPAAPDPAAEAMLTALQQRIAKAPPAPSSIVRQLLQRDRKQRRAELAAQVMPEALPVQSPEALPEYHEGRYRAEDEPWFARLPVAEQDRLRGVWDQQRTAGAVRHERTRKERLETFWVAYVVFFFAGFPMFAVGGFASFLTMALAGCVTGMVWQMLPRDRFACAASASAVFGVLIVGSHYRAMTNNGFLAAYVFIVWSLVTWLSALAVATREIRRSGGMVA
jgi:hypothetical protein